QPRSPTRRRVGYAWQRYPGRQKPAPLDRALGYEAAGRRHAGSHGGDDVAHADGRLASAARQPLASPLRRYSTRGRLGRQEALRAGKTSGSRSSSGHGSDGGFTGTATAAARAATFTG